ncbi:hypothetical protein [Priestia aryabhattai]|uniref:hypothetical protein n=1 Tax=Priestia aryabhattai TaxID=412384 RepID=UPI0015F53E1B|nr:hypothetical protein [Priestia aryabhattai]
MTDKKKVNQITYETWDSDSFKELQNYVANYIVNIAKENNLTGDEFTECVLDLCKKFTTSYEAECGIMIVENLTGKKIVKLNDILERGDKIRRKSDGKIFTYTGKAESDYEDYGHVKEMAVPVHLPDFEKEEPVLFPKSNPFLDKLRSDSIKDEKYSFESESITDRNSK